MQLNIAAEEFYKYHVMLAHKILLEKHRSLLFRWLPLRVAKPFKSFKEDVMIQWRRFLQDLKLENVMFDRTRAWLKQGSRKPATILRNIPKWTEGCYFLLFFVVDWSWVMLTTLKQFPRISFLFGIFEFWVWTSADCISPLNFLKFQDTTGQCESRLGHIVRKSVSCEGVGPDVRNHHSASWTCVLDSIDGLGVPLSQSSHLVQVKLIDFDTVETVQPQTPKKAKVRISLSHQAGQNEPRINGGWYLTSDVFQFVTEMLHNEHTHPRRKLSCIVRVAGCAWYGPVHCTRGQKQADEYRYKITPARFICSQSIWFYASNSNFCFVQRHMTGTTPLLRISLLWEWLDTGQMPRGSKKQQSIVMEWMEWLVSTSFIQ